MSEFCTESKSSASYIDIAANGSGVEKSMLTVEAYSRLLEHGNSDPVRILEIGPGGGSALSTFVQKISSINTPRPVHMSLLELDGIQSISLQSARGAAEHHGMTTSFHSGSATDLSNLLPKDSIDIVSTSAVIHEVYSYAGNYAAIDKTFQGIADILRPGGFYSYRDVYGVKNLSMHERTRHVYDRSSWVAFYKLFLDYYTTKADHPYKHYDDRIKLSQNGRATDIDCISVSEPLSIEAPIGLLREVQRHYITMRDFLWRSGSLGVIPELDDPHKTNDWIDRHRGHKRIHFQMIDNDPLLKAMSAQEAESEEYIVDGDIFDNTSDVRLSEVLIDIIKKADASEYWKVWTEWLNREGSETYFYMPIGQLLGSVALNSFEATNGDGILLPTNATDILKIDRSYYNRYLESKLSNPLYDGKQLVLFEFIPLRNKGDDLQEKINGALGALSLYCSHDVLSNIYTPIRKALR